MSDLDHFGLDHFGVPGRPTLLECLRAAVQYHQEQNNPRAAQRSSLIKLACSAIDLHAIAMAKGVKPWPDGEGPLAVALTALQTVARNEGVQHD
jgi:hypothetical protein